jgi:hypothetical protein
VFAAFSAAIKSSGALLWRRSGACEKCRRHCVAVNLSLEFVS